MIGALKGTVYSKSQQSLILFVGNVGYTVYTTQTLLNNTLVGNEIFLFIHTHIREDAFDLFGFSAQQELHLFELLLTVSGIGPKTALAVMEKGTGQIQTAVQASDVDFFTSVPRLGRKNAQKIIIELKTTLGGIQDLDMTALQTEETKELMDALLSMGFQKSEIRNALAAIPSGIHTTIEEKIRACLKQLNKKP